jgi:hypothetical protein
MRLGLLFFHHAFTSKTADRQSPKGSKLKSRIGMHDSER